MTRTDFSTKTQYVVILGVNVQAPETERGYHRVAAVEVGGFDSLLAAKSFMELSNGKPAALALDMPSGEAYDLPEDEIRDQQYIAVGHTIEFYTDLHGTFDSLDFENLKGVSYR